MNMERKFYMPDDNNPQGLYPMRKTSGYFLPYFPAAGKASGLSPRKSSPVSRHATSMGGGISNNKKAQQ